MPTKDRVLSGVIFGVGSLLLGLTTRHFAMRYKRVKNAKVYARHDANGWYHQLPINQSIELSDERMDDGLSIVDIEQERVVRITGTVDSPGILYIRTHHAQYDALVVMGYMACTMPS